MFGSVWGKACDAGIKDLSTLVPEDYQRFANREFNSMFKKYYHRDKIQLEALRTEDQHLRKDGQTIHEEAAALAEQAKKSTRQKERESLMSEYERYNQEGLHFQDEIKGTCLFVGHQLYNAKCAGNIRQYIEQASQDPKGGFVNAASMMGNSLGSVCAVFIEGVCKPGFFPHDHPTTTLRNEFIAIVKFVLGDYQSNSIPLLNTTQLLEKHVRRAQGIMDETLFTELIDALTATEIEFKRLEEVPSSFVNWH